jgi:predicted nuclease with TOPRIM domain
VTVDYFEMKRRHKNIAEQEAAGKVADSMEVRTALIKRMDAGELTLDQVQAELKRIKRGASRAGQTTRAKAWYGR